MVSRNITCMQQRNKVCFEFELVVRERNANFEHAIDSDWKQFEHMKDFCIIPITLNDINNMSLRML